MKMNFVEIFGWYGTTAIVTAYFLLTLHTIDTGLTYQILNLTGAVGVGLVSFAKGAKQPGVLNIMWGAIALVGIVNLLR